MAVDNTNKPRDFPKLCALGMVQHKTGRHRIPYPIPAGFAMQANNDAATIHIG
jgi:hypothetical protein